MADGMTVLTAITKRRDAYLVRGVHDGRRASFYIAAQDVEEASWTRDDFEAFCLRRLPDCLEDLPVAV